MKQVINLRPQTPQEQSVAKPGTPLQNILIENTHLKQMSISISHVMFLF